jgi:TolB-like protein
LEAHSVERKLAAIFAADVEGYSRLMGRNEVGTLHTLTAYRVIIDRLIASHRGRIFNTAGDSLVADFASAVDAVQCAVAVQDAIANENAGRPAAEQMRFRIGIHVGDIIVQGDNLFGDAVNVAARLEALAEPGGICVSGSVRDHIGTNLPLSFTDLGQQQVKNIAQPIKAYRIRDEISPTANPVSGSSLPLPDKPSIAVLPFQNMSGDPEQEYFTDGMVEEIITALSRIKWLFVIARNSSFTYKGRAIDVTQVGRELGVRYVLEGSVRKAGQRLRITGQLIDAVTGTHLWADRFDGTLEDVFDLQDQVALSVAGLIEPTLRQVEIERARRKRPDSLDAYDLYLRALPYAFTAMPEDADKALTLLGKAIELEPDYAAAHAIIAWCHEQRYLRGGLDEKTRTAALHHARQAIAVGGDDAAALATAGFVIAVADHDYETALTAFDRSFALSNSCALALGFSSIVRAWKGDDDIAVEQGKLALRLSPFDPLIYLPCVGLAYAHFAARRFEEAAAAMAHSDRPMVRSSTSQRLISAKWRSPHESHVSLPQAMIVRRTAYLQPGARRRADRHKAPQPCIPSPHRARSGSDW